MELMQDRANLTQVRGRLSPVPKEEGLLVEDVERIQCTGQSWSQKKSLLEKG